MTDLQRFDEIAERYPVLFFDSYGVLRNSMGLIDGVAEVLADLKDRGKRVYVLTNDASRAPSQLTRKFHHGTYGSLIPEDHLITSGILASRFMREKVRGPVAYLGRRDSAYYIEAAGCTAIPMAEIEPGDEIAAVALLDDEGFDWVRDLNRAINLIRRRTLPVIVANSDHVYPVDDRDVAIAVGGLAKMMERILGMQFLRFGKPDTLMFSYAFRQARAVDPDLRKSHVLMVGDTLQTDILGANKFGLDSVLVLSGNTLPTHAERQIAHSGLIPNYLCASVAE